MHKTMKIIFLDIDGVINPWSGGGERHERIGRFGKVAVESLNLILEAVPEVSIVISSTWRLDRTLPEMKEIFSESGINPDRLVDVTPDLRRYEGNIRHDPGRNEEIQAWLDQHPEVEKFAVIDDVDYEQMEGLEEHFFQTVFEVGLLLEHTGKIINHLK